MKSISKILVAITVLLPYTNIFAQIKNSKTETVKIYGNCGMCKSNIENAGDIKNVVQVNWSKDTKTAILSFDDKKTNPDEILKRIALAGYDSEKFLAPDEVYAKLPECCQYKRDLKPKAMSSTSRRDMKNEHNHSDMAATKTSDVQDAPQLKAVFDNYFSLKDALVKTDGNASSATASELAKAIKEVVMAKFSTDEHKVWMKIMKDLSLDAEHISETKDVAHQRDHFTSLSKNMYELLKATKLNTVIYYQKCPMYDNGKGANWLSKEDAIRNPYYGSKMLTCGNTVETIK